MAETPPPGDDVALALAGVKAGVQILWDRLVPTCAVAAGPNGDRVRRSTLSFDSSLAFIASTTLWQTRASVRVNAGILWAMIEVARTVASASSNEELTDIHASAQDVIDDAGARIAAEIQWLTSVAGHPIPLTLPSLGPNGEQFAVGLATGALSFVLAHELGHVALEQPRQRDGAGAHEREYAADSWASRLLRSLPTPPPLAEGEAPTLENVLLDPDTTIPAAAVFLLFEGLRLRAKVSRDAFVAGTAINEGLTLLDFTDTASHPSPYRRLERLRANTRMSNQDGSELAGIDALLQGFERLLPAIERNMPEHLITEADLAELPSGLAIEDGATWDEVYRTGIVRRLDAVAAHGEPGEDDVAWFLEAVQCLPRTALDTLAAAVGGRPILGATTSPAELARALESLPSRIPNPLVRQAILRYAA